VPRTGKAEKIQEELLIEGLQRSIDSDNKGFAMLAKMGFKYVKAEFCI